MSYTKVLGDLETKKSSVYTFLDNLQPWYFCLDLYFLFFSLHDIGSVAFDKQKNVSFLW